MDCLIIDIETRPDPRIWDDADRVEEIRDGIEAPKNYKDPLKIAEYADLRLEELKTKAALRPQTGKVACIGMLPLDDYDPGVPIEAVAATVDSWASDDEPELLQRFAMQMQRDQSQLIGGYYLREFDVPFITYRCAVHGVELPNWWPNRRDWNRIVDPCDLWPKTTAGSLDEHLVAMGLPRKTATGEESLTMPLEELAEYCAHDVAVEAALIHRLRRQFPSLNLPTRSISA